MSFFAQNLRHLRQQKHFTQIQFSHELGLLEDSIKRFERGAAEPDYETLIDISNRLQISIDQLLKTNLDFLSRKVSGKDIRLILLDIDGTLTDGGMYYTEQGDQFKRFDVKDGMIISRLIKRKGWQFGFISSASTTGIISKRAEHLGVQKVYAGKSPKTEIVDGWLSEMELTYSQVAYVGDDLNDLELIRLVGLSACPADAVRTIKDAVDVVLTREGGKGCIREFIENVLGLTAD